MAEPNLPASDVKRMTLHCCFYGNILSYPALTETLEYPSLLKFLPHLDTPSLFPPQISEEIKNILSQHYGKHQY